MTTKRQPFNTLTKKTILIDLNGKRVTCAFPGCTCDATHIHHEKMVSEGGTNELSNLKPMCSKHHIWLHSVRGDFREFGRKGGLATAATKKSFKNLKQYRNKEIQLDV